MLRVTNLTQGKLRGSDWPEVQIMCSTTSISTLVWSHYTHPTALFLPLNSSMLWRWQGC